MPAGDDRQDVAGKPLFHVHPRREGADQQLALHGGVVAREHVRGIVRGGELLARRCCLAGKSEPVVHVEVVERPAERAGLCIGQGCVAGDQRFIGRIPVGEQPIAVGGCVIHPFTGDALAVASQHVGSRRSQFAVDQLLEVAHRGFGQSTRVRIVAHQRCCRFHHAPVDGRHDHERHHRLGCTGTQHIGELLRSWLGKVRHRGLRRKSEHQGRGRPQGNEVQLRELPVVSLAGYRSHRPEYGPGLRGAAMEDHISSMSRPARAGPGFRVRCRSTRLGAVAHFEIDPRRSSVHIAGSSSVHPITADANGLSGWFEVSLRSRKLLATPNLAGELSVPVELLESGNSLVDRETRRRIDAQRHPEIAGKVLTSHRIDTDSMEVTGTIAFRGETREVTGTLNLEASGEDLILSGEQTFDVREWGLRLPRLGLLRVHPDVTVSIHLHGTPG